MRVWRLLSARIALPRARRGGRVRTTTLAERLFILTVFIFFTVVLEPWWARLVLGLVSAVALFNVVGIVWLLRKGKSVPIGDRE